VCFLSHQAVEKALKALRIKRLGVYSQTQSIAKLIEDVRGVIVIPEELAEKAGKLDRYYIPTRYPNV
jgi:HEPN domain-containing protein